MSNCGDCAGTGRVDVELLDVDDTVIASWPDDCCTCRGTGRTTASSVGQPPPPPSGPARATFAAAAAPGDDPRVHWLNRWAARVAADDTYDLEADSPDRWIVAPSLNSQAVRDAHLRTRADADAFAARNWWGPYPSADQAITAVFTGQLRRTGL